MSNPKDAVFVDETDYVLSIKQLKDGSSAVSSIVNELKKGGFYVAATYTPGNQQLLLVRLSPKTLAKQAAIFQSRDVTAGVPTPAFSLDGEGVTPAFRARIVYETLQSLGLTPDRSKAIEDVWPYGHAGVERSLFSKALHSFIVSPETVRSQYGDEIALYFAFAGHATKLVIIPAVLSLLGDFLGPYSSVVGALNVAWAIFFAFAWRYNESVYANQWDTNNVQFVTTRRQNFSGTTPRSRQLRSLFYLPLAAFLCLIYVSGVVFGLSTEVFFTQIYDGPGQKILALAPTAGYVVLAQIFRLVYDKFTDAYLKYEDYPTVEEEQRHRVQRQFWATFFLNYTPILLSAYLYLPFGHLIAYNFGTIKSSIAGYSINVVPAFELNTGRLAAQTKYYAITNQLVLFATDALLPLVKAFLAKRKIKPSQYAHAQLEAALPTYDVGGDYLIITSLLGYALITSPVWPLAPLAVAIGISLRSKATALKLAYDFRRPNVRRVNTIGSWNSNIFFLAGLASVTTPTIIAMYQTAGQWSANKSLVNITPAAILALAFLSENLFLVVSKAIEVSFKTLLPAPNKKLPLVQSDAAPRPTMSDLEWSNHNIAEDLKKLE